MSCFFNLVDGDAQVSVFEPYDQCIMLPDGFNARKRVSLIVVNDGVAFDEKRFWAALFDRFDELGEEDGKTLAGMARERFDKEIVDGWLERAGLADGE